MTNKEEILEEIEILKNSLDLYEKNFQCNNTNIDIKNKIELLRNNIERRKLILKDLEDYEELKELMGTPIQDIMKKLKVLDILKKAYKENRLSIFKIQSASDYLTVKEWLDEKNE